MRSRLSMAALCALACATLFSGAAARAAITHKYLSQITEVPAGSGASLPGPIISPIALAFDSGELYVDDNSVKQPEYRVDKFDASTGAFVSQFPQVLSLSYLHQGVAVGHATGEAAVYVAGDELDTANGVVAVFDNAGNLVNVWNGAAAKGAATPSEAFGCFQCADGMSSLAADNSGSLSWAAGDVYVTDPEHGVVDVFKPEAGGKEPAQLAAQLSGPEAGVPFTGPSGLAVNQSNDELLVVDARDVVDIFKPAALTGEYELTGKLTGTPAGPLGYITGVATDAADGDIYVADGESGVDQFSSAGAFLGRIVGTPAGPFTTGAASAGLGVSSVAVDPGSGKVYVGEIRSSGENSSVGSVDVFSANLIIPDVTTESASSIKPNSATLNGTVNPNEAGSATCQFLWGTSTSFGQVAPCSGPIAEGNAPVAVQSALTGLQPDTTYHYRLRATNGNETNPGEPSQDQEFTTSGPGIHGTSVADVASSSATLEATIDPNSARATYHFQYGTSTGYGSEVPLSPGATVGSGRGDVEVSQHLQGLTAGLLYHYRVVVLSELGSKIEVFEGPDETFTTQAVGGALTAPDGRAWEMVSPPDKQGAQIFAIDQYGAEGSVIQASAAGGAITYLTSIPTELEPQGYTNRVQVLSSRAPDAWHSQDIAIPHESATDVSLEGQEYRLFSEDLSLGAVQPFGGFTQAVSKEASEQTPYLRTDYLNGDVSDPCTVTCYRPLVTGATGHENVPAGTVFGGETDGKCVEENGLAFVSCGPELIGATPDMSHVVLLSAVGLASTPAQGEGGLYEWSNGKLILVSILPDGTAAENSRNAQPNLGYLNVNARHAISTDGARVVWTEKELHLYMSDVAKGETVQLDTVQGGSGEGEVAPEFQIASSDGSRVFFTDGQHLTTGSGGDHSRESDLYECEMVEVAGKLGCKLSDLTLTGSGEQADVLGVVAGAGEDGSRIYFVANGVLAPGATHGSCSAIGPSVGTMCNLYVHEHGVTKLVAVISGEDSPGWGVEAAGPLPSLAARVSPNGRWLAFMSQRALTGYDNRDAVSGNPDEEVYLYDAEGDAGSGHLVCASCDPTGARPLGVEGNKLFNGLAGGAYVWERQWLAANIPGWTPYTTSTAGKLSRYQSRYLSDGGRLFFNSSDTLVRQDVDGTEDVYEYEPPGVGDCGSSSMTFSARSGGCVGLISSGDSAEESGFMDASESGGDVFFLTAAKLSAADSDSALDIYDAHECTGASPCFAQPPAQPPACDTGDSCKPAPSPQPEVFGSPASATFAGSGNVAPSVSKVAIASKGLTRAQKLARALKRCARQKRKRSAKCVRQARARYGAKKAVKANAIKRGRG